MPRKFSIIGALFAALAVMTGAFGSHALKGRLDAYAIGIWETAVLYHFIHALGLLAIAALSSHASPRLANASGWCLAIGVLLFSGSLYALALFGSRGGLGFVTPIGGSAFIAGWLLFAVALWRGRGRATAV
ncbi:MAG: DUF423 domain-containing protein [Ectothiorhodospiraceae bacterium]|jgi:uncharacterized membrane protein YgdD (TMEM256/DUF423 family)|nr:DUF423 domain-containing protein [Ectothiorhodospiraceae bacterium]